MESAEAYTVSAVLFFQSGPCSKPVYRTTQELLERTSRSDLKQIWSKVLIVCLVVSMHK